jgi:isoquinoline 1-oxidoreductase beta subunit
LKHGAQWVAAKLGRELGIMFTGGSTSVKDAWQPMREAGAVARAAAAGGGGAVEDSNRRG